MKNKNKNKNIHYLFWYFIIFSFVGLIIETLFCYITTGVIESRKGFLIGPFCPIYGVGATCLIFLLDKYKDKDFKIFILGGIIGSIIEYILSFALEALYGTRFWDYNDKNFNLNGRICLLYSIYWGILSILLMKYICPKLNHYIDKIPEKIIKLIDTILIIFFVLNMFITIWAVSVYKERVINEYNNIIIEKKDNIKTKIEENLFSNEIMKNIFPNLRMRDAEKNIIFIKDMIN